jgi:uncharacterized metal-binding protein YceD (DUF177 family)|tara:strand:- start:1952 stop:2500 length:549 start_codon:yes stop_codon:yes gene_type:complete
MIFNLSGLLSGTLGESRQHEIENEQLTVADRLLTHINGPIYLIRTDRTVILDADITAVTQETCSRCLEAAPVNIRVKMDEEFYPLNMDLMDHLDSNSQDNDHYHDPALIIDKRNVLDLTEGLGQALVAAIPIAPLCKDECLGICAICAANRNLIDCSCPQSRSDLRWKSLDNLLDKGAESAG